MIQDPQTFLNGRVEGRRVEGKDVPKWQAREVRSDWVDDWVGQ